MGPLEGVKIIEVGGIGPGPFCGMMLSDMGADIVRIERKGGLLDESKRQLELAIYDINGTIASVGLMSAVFYDYLQLVKIDGRWQIVNVLWKMNPDAPKPEKS